MIPWSNAVLTGVINKRRPVRTTVLDTHFTRRTQVASSSVQVDVIQGPEGLMVAISREAESRKAAQAVVSTQGFVIPRFSEHDFVTAGEQIMYRAPGVIGGGEAFDAIIARKLDLLRSRIDRTKEFMAIKALQGSVVDGAGNVIATYPVPAAVALNTATTSPRDSFDTAAVAIARALGVESATLTAYCGVTAYQKIRAHADVKALLQGPAGPTMLESGELRKLDGVTIRRISGQYVDNAGATQNFLADNAVIFAAAEADFELVHGPCSGAGGTVVLLPYYAQQSEVDDPPSTKVRAESNPLPIVNRPEAVYQLTVS